MITRALLLVLVFGIVYGTVGALTGWMAFGWLVFGAGTAAEDGMTGRLIGMLLFHASATVIIGLMVGRVIAAPWLRVAAAQWVITVAIGAALLFMGVLLAFSAPLRGQDLSPESSAPPVLLWGGWLALGPGVSTLLLIWLLKFRK